MTTRTVTSVVLTCDDSGTEAFNEDEHGEHGYTVHFADTAEAYAFATSVGWFINGDRAICGDCLTRHSCARLGHDWTAWRDVVHDLYVGQTRTCKQCGDLAYAPPLEVSP